MRRRVADGATVAALFADKATSSATKPAEGDALLAAVFDASPDGLAVLARDGRLLALNAAGRAMLSKAADGKALSACLAPESRVGFEAALARAAAGQQAQTQCLADGVRWLEFTVLPLTVGTERCVLAIGRDIEEPERARERRHEAEKLEAIGRLAGGVAHDFNNILTVIIGNSELLAERLPADDDGRKLADISLAAAHAGADLTRMLLAYSRRQALQPSEFCAADMLREMRGLIERSLGETIALQLATDADPWGVRADRAQLANVLLNLALNARDAMPRGGRLNLEARNVTLDDSEARACPPGQYVMLAASDTGTGIPPAVLERVFEPFFTTKEAGKGSGLGLAMVQGFARQSGGHVEIESRPDAGTTVKLYLPRAQVQLRLPNMEADTVDLRARPGEAVLVVDDNAAVRSLIASQLESLGYVVTTAADGNSASTLLRRADRIDLLVSDIAMPGIDGVKLAERARRKRPDMKVILISGHAEHVAGSTGRAALVGSFLAKPFTRLELARRVRAAIDGRL